MKLKNLLWYWTPVGVYCGIIWYLSSFSFPPEPQSIAQVSDKIKHVIEFFILAILIYRAVYNTVSIRYAYILTITLTSVYGIVDEFHQSFVPGRMFSGYDMLADALGAFFIMNIKIAKIVWKKVTIDVTVPAPDKEE